MLKKEGVTKAGDVYQVGVVLYEMLVGIPPYYNDNIKVLYQNIEKGKLKIPKYLSTEAKKCLLKMLHRNPNKRPTLESIVNDPFFAGINWKKLEKMQIEPPSVLKEVQLGSSASSQALQNDEELAMLFESPDQSTGGNEDEQRGGSKSIF